MPTSHVMILMASCVAAACGDDAPGDLDMGAPGEDASARIEGACASGSCLFVGEIANLPAAPAGTTVVVGANIDGVITHGGDATGCGKLDFTHPDGTAGVDNQLATLVPAVETLASIDVDELIAAGIADGTVLLMFSVEGVDSPNDDSVNAAVFLGAVPEGATIQLDDDGTLAAAQTFDVISAPLNVAGAMVDGVFVADIPMIEVPLPLGDTPLTLTVRDASVRVEITEDGLRNGQLAGALDVDELATAFDAVGLAGLDTETVRAVLSAAADLSPNGATCERVSAALTFGATTAVRGITR